MGSESWWNFYYNTSYKRFVQIKNLKVPVEDMDKRAFVTDDGVLWIFTQQTGSLIQCSLGWLRL